MPHPKFSPTECALARFAIPEGSFVRNGQLLFEIDPRPFQVNQVISGCPGFTCLLSSQCGENINVYVPTAHVALRDGGEREVQSPLTACS
jgi:hypothetical protein